MYNHCILIIKGKVMIYIQFIEKITFSTQNNLKMALKSHFVLSCVQFSLERFSPQNLRLGMSFKCPQFLENSQLDVLINCVLIKIKKRNTQLKWSFMKLLLTSQSFLIKLVFFFTIRFLFFTVFILNFC